MVYVTRRYMNFGGGDPNELGLSRYRRDERQLLAIVSGHRNDIVYLPSGITEAIGLNDPRDDIYATFLRLDRHICLSSEATLSARSAGSAEKLTGDLASREPA